MVLALYLASSEVENDRRSLNVRLGLRKARKEGRWPGPAPLGYMNVTSPNGRKYIIPHEPEASIVKRIFAMLADGGNNLSMVYRNATAAGLKCSNSHFLELIRNPFYCGKVLVPAFESEKEYFVKGIHEQLIPDQLFERVQAIILDRKRVLTAAHTEEQLLLRGFLLCPDCGKTLTGSASRGRYKRYFYYHCSKGCRFRVRADQANDELIQVIKDLRPNELYVDVFKLVLEEVYRELYEKKTMDQAHLMKSMEQMIDRVVNAREALYKGSIDSEDFSAIKDDCERRINALGLQLQQATVVQLTKREKLEKLAGSIYDLTSLFDKADVFTKRQFIKLMLAGKVVYTRPMTHTIGIGFRTIFDLNNEFLMSKTVVEPNGQFIHENAFYQHCEQLIMNRLGLSGAILPGVTDALKSLEQLALIVLRQNC